MALILLTTQTAEISSILFKMKQVTAWKQSLSHQKIFSHLQTAACKILMNETHQQWKNCKLIHPEDVENLTKVPA